MDAGVRAHIRDLRQRLPTNALLAYPNLNEPLFLEADATRFVIGAVIPERGTYGTSGALPVPVHFRSPNETAARPVRKCALRMAPLGTFESICSVNRSHCALSTMRTNSYGRAHATWRISALARYSYLHSTLLAYIALDRQNPSPDALSRYPVVLPVSNLQEVPMRPNILSMTLQL